MEDNFDIKYYAICKVINPTDKEYDDIIKEINKCKVEREDEEVKDG